MGDNETETAERENNVHPALAELFQDGELAEQVVKDKAKKVRRTMRKAKHFSRQDKPLKRSRSFALDSVDQLKELASFDDALTNGDWTVFSKQSEAIEDCIEPFYDFYGSHGKLPDIDLGEALSYVLYVGIVHGDLDLGLDFEMSRDTPRGSYP